MTLLSSATRVVGGHDRVTPRRRASAPGTRGHPDAAATLRHVDSLSGLWDAFEAFIDSLAAVHIGALIAALLFHAANLVLRSRAWTTILSAAYPGRGVRWKDVFGAYATGVGVNGIVPARGGDAVKLFLIHSRIRGATYPTIGSSLLAETLFDSAVAFLLVGWAWQIGVADGLPGSGLFELSWLGAHPQLYATIAILLAGAAAAVVVVHGARVRAFRDRVTQGLAILRDRRRYLRQVASLQAAGWVCRALSAHSFLRAFRLDAGLKNTLLVLVIGSIATGMPLTPGGLGPKQALAVAILGAAGTRTTVLAFSIGMEIAILAFNLALAMVCLSFMMKGVRLRDTVKHARAQRAAADVDGAPPDDPPPERRTRSSTVPDATDDEWRWHD